MGLTKEEKDDQKKKIHRQILKVGYDNPFTWNTLKRGDFKDFFPSLFFEEAVDMYHNHFIMFSPDGFNTKQDLIEFCIKERGLIEWENSINGKYTGEIIRLLKIFENRDSTGIPQLPPIGTNEHLKYYQITRIEIYEEMHNDNTILSNDEMDKLLKCMQYTVKEEHINELDMVDKSSPDGVSNKISNPHLAITEIGFQLLKEYRQAKNLFTKRFLSPIRTQLIEELHTLDKLRQMELWKEALIKMGSILECLLTYWITNNSKFKPKSDKFQDILVFRRDNNYRNEIGETTDWDIVDKLIRDYRNYIHLKKYFESKNTINYSHFEQLYPVFQRLIIYF